MQRQLTEAVCHVLGCNLAADTMLKYMLGPEFALARHLCAKAGLIFACNPSPQTILRNQMMGSSISNECQAGNIVLYTCYQYGVYIVGPVSWIKNSVFLVDFYWRLRWWLVYFCRARIGALIRLYRQTSRRTFHHSRPVPHKLISFYC